MQLRSYEATMGMFHFFMTALALFFNVHFGEPDSLGSLSFWIDWIHRDRNKLWSPTEATHVKDFNAYLDFFQVLLDAYSGL